MPILDIQCYVIDNQIRFKFYKKPVSNPLLISEILSEFSHKLKCSGWDEKSRYDFIMAGLTGYKRQLERAEAGICPLYRPWELDRESRRKKKILAKTSWYRPHDAVMFVPATQGSGLRNIIQNIVTQKTAELGMSLLVRETSGKKMKDSLVRLDLTGCIFLKCLACKSGLDGASHTRSGTQYDIVCKVCRANNILAEYHGESRSNAVHRLSEHEAAIVNKNTGNAMAKHLAIFHKEKEGDPDNFEYSVAATFKKNLERQISEAVSLKYSNPDIVMNQKNEHHGPAMHRTSTTQELRNGS